jgi:ATP adenylyltransferase
VSDADEPVVEHAVEPADQPVVEAAWELAGEPDGFGRLWTPYRMAYLQGADKPADDGSRECPFCRAPKRADEEGLVVARGELAYVVMNLYPYNTGHVMVCPYRHVSLYTELTPEETVEVGTLTQTAMTVIEAISGAQGFNIGMNQGSAGGAGIAAHLHQHIVPRWGGDANFLPIVGQTKALPELLSDTRRRLAEAWPVERPA